MEWDKYEKEMKEVKSIFQDIANEKKIQLLNNHKGWPNICLKWQSNNSIKQLQFFLESNMKLYSLSGYKTTESAAGESRSEIIEFMGGVSYPFLNIDKKSILRLFEKMDNM